ncbi:MAG: histidine--tRNA ligase, partial [Solirubrobacterales bacterium]
RAYLEHGMHKLAQPVKLFYSGPFFRHERPQAGRFRQFHQIGLEAIGTDSPAADAEAIATLDTMLRTLGVSGVKLKLGSLGSLETRREYHAELKAYLREHDSELSRDVRERIDLNPLRAFDSDDPGTRAVMADAPKIIDRLEGADAEHFEHVRAYLGVAGVTFELDPTLVRGLDYYTRTIFSFVCDQLGAQSEVAGGGRYDGLIEQLGGPPTPAVGWAAGVERILLALNPEPKAPKGYAFVAIAEQSLVERALELVGELRERGKPAELDLAGRGLKGQLKQAARIGARWTVIIEADDAAQLRDMETGDQESVHPDELIERIGGHG